MSAVPRRVAKLESQFYDASSASWSAISTFTATTTRAAHASVATAVQSGSISADTNSDISNAPVSNLSTPELILTDATLKIRLLMLDKRRSQLDWHVVA